MDMTAAAAAELAKESQQALFQRLHNGGQSMPPFQQLSDAEVRSLVAYLNQLAQVPGAKQFTVTESPMRAGELIAKSTCHVCHDAVGPNPTPEQLENGAIPPLATLTSRVNQLEFIRKVTSGAPIVMGTPPTPHRGRMPVFYYLTREEAADVYAYLATYPPSEFPHSESLIESRGQDKSEELTTPTLQAKSTANSPVPEKGQARRSAGLPDWAVTVFLTGAAMAVFALLMAGLAFAAFELNRLGNSGEYHARHGETRHVAVDAPELAIRYRQSA